MLTVTRLVVLILCVDKGLGIQYQHLAGKDARELEFFG